MALTDYMSTQQSQLGTQAGQQAQQAMNVYNPAQQGLQGNLGGFYNQLLQGNIPQQFTNPQPAIGAYEANFANYVAPQIAAQYGAGSPAIGSQNALGLQQLQGQLYNMGVGNFMNALGGAGNYAFNPIGGTQNIGTTGTNTMAANTMNQINPLVFGLLQLLQGTLGG